MLNLENYKSIMMENLRASEIYFPREAMQKIYQKGVGIAKKTAELSTLADDPLTHIRKHKQFLDYYNGFKTHSFWLLEQFQVQLRKYQSRLTYE